VNKLLLDLQLKQEKEMVYKNILKKFKKKLNVEIENFLIVETSEYNILGQPNEEYFLFYQIRVN
jgi:hypothetical protein